MRPLKTDATNTELTHDEGPNLPATRTMFNDGPGWETLWELEPGEIAALANAGALRLRLWGKEHPPVALVVSEPVASIVPVYTKRRVDLAFGLFLAKWSEWMARNGERVAKLEEEGRADELAPEVNRIFERAVTDSAFAERILERWIEAGKGEEGAIKVSSALQSGEPIPSPPEPTRDNGNANGTG